MNETLEMDWFVGFSYNFAIAAMDFRDSFVIDFILELFIFMLKAL